MHLNIYLEDWSNGMLNSEDYVFHIINSLKDEGIERFMLPDTLECESGSDIQILLYDDREMPEHSFRFSSA